MTDNLIKLTFRVEGYDVLRNRMSSDGSEWLSSRYKQVYSQKLYSNNIPYCWFRRYMINHPYFKQRVKEKLPLLPKLKHLISK